MAAPAARGPMAEDYRDTAKELEALEHLDDHVAKLEEIAVYAKRIEDIKKQRAARARQEREREARHAKLREAIDRDRGKATEAAAAEAAAAEAQVEADDAARQQAEADDPEPPATEPFCLLPPPPQQQQAAAPGGGPVDLALLDLPTPPGPESWALLQQLLATRQLFAFAGALTPDAAAPLLQLLFRLLWAAEQPHAALEQLADYYAHTRAEDVGWAPQLQDFLDALKAMGYRPPPPQGHAQARGGGGGAAAAAAAAVADAGAAAAEPAAGPRVRNLQALLRLLALLAPLARQGRLDMGFTSSGEAAGKALMGALLRMLLDGQLCRALYSDVRAALEALTAPWDEPQWRRVGDDAAAAAAAAGPSHRAAYRVVAAVQGCSERLRGWQQGAALALLRRVAPPQGGAAAGVSGGSSGGTRRGEGGVDAREAMALLGERPTFESVSVLLRSLKRPRGGGGGGGEGAKPDYWRLFTILQCVHVIVWNADYHLERSDAEPLVRWCSTLFKLMDQRLKQGPTEMTIKVWLNEVLSHYETSGGKMD